MLVTAAAGTGIGFATARRCAEEGARVAISDRHERRLAEAADRLAELTGTGRSRSRATSPTEAQVEHLIDTVVAEYGGIDVLVNNAGLGGTAERRRHDRRAVGHACSTSRSPARSAAPGPRCGT